MPAKNKRIIDAHCHIQFPIYDDDRNEVIKRAQGAGVKMIVAGTQISTSEAAIRLSHEYSEDIWATVGFHPSHAAIGHWHHDANEQKENTPEKFDIKRLKELATDFKVVGIGECGLDYYRLAESEKLKVKSIQKKVFMEMAELASELKKPLIIHCRPSKDSDDAYVDLLDLFFSGPKIEFKILHCFSGNLEISKKMSDAGFYFTFGGAVTFRAKRDKNKCAYDDVIKYLPVDMMMLETDSPYLTPVPYRRERNEPAFIAEVVRKIAEIKNMPLEDLAEKISGTANKIFKI